MFAQNIHQEGVEVQGDHDVYINFMHIWRRVLEMLHESFCGPIEMELQPHL